MMGHGSCYGWDATFAGGYMGGGWLGLLLLSAVVALVVIGIAFAVRPRGGLPGDPREILRARFARGEISAEEFEQARRALGV